MSGVIWVSSVGGDWNDGNNWSSGAPPQPEDSVTIINNEPTEMIIQLDAPTLIGDLTLSGNGPITIGTLGNLNTITFRDGGQISNYSSYSHTIYNPIIGNTLIVSGNLSEMLNIYDITVPDTLSIIYARLRGVVTTPTLLFAPVLYSGNVSVSEVSQTANLGSTAVVIDPVATLVFANSGSNQDVAINATISGGGNIIFNGPDASYYMQGSLNGFSGNITNNEFSNLIIAPTEDASFSPASLNNASAIYPISIDIGVGLSMSLNTVINTANGNLLLTKLGDGTLNLSGTLTNTFYDNTPETVASIIVSGGIFELASPGSAGVQIVVNGAGINMLADTTQYASLTLAGPASYIIDSTITYTNNTLPLTLQTGQKLVINGTYSPSALGDLVIPSGVILGGSGIINVSVVMDPASVLAVGNSPGLLTINGNLTLSTGVILDWDLWGNDNNIINRGTIYDAIDITGQLDIQDPSIRLNILTAPPTDFSNVFWTTAQSWNYITAGTIIGSPLTNIHLYENGVISTIGSSNSQGTFGAETNGSNINITWLYNPSAGGDPHITTIAGHSYMVDNLEKALVMYDNGEIQIDTEMRRMLNNYWKNPVHSDVLNSTYMYQTRITLGDNELIIGNHSLEILYETNHMNYQLCTYDPKDYKCYGKIIPRGEFKAKILTIDTNKLSDVKIIFVKLNDDTIITDMKLITSSKLRSVWARGALVSKDSIIWGPSF